MYSLRSCYYWLKHKSNDKNLCHWKLLISPVEVTVLIFVTRWQNKHLYSPRLTFWSLKFVWMMYKSNDTTNTVHWSCMLEICFILINMSHTMLPLLLVLDFCIVKNAIYEICTNFCLSHMTLRITISKTNLNNADINELYLVQISGLWGSSQLLHNHWSSSYFKTMFNARDIAANWNTRQLLLHSITYTLPKW
jgi:hypothetical protein